MQTTIIITKKNGMTKQEVLDKVPENNEEYVLQNMLLRFSKTKLRELVRNVRAIGQEVLWKSYLQNMSWAVVTEKLREALQILEEEAGENGTNEISEMVGEQQIRRPRNRRGDQQGRGGN